jgi:hypothetical protein
VLVLASVLPAALNPSTGVRPTTVKPTVVRRSTRAVSHEETLAFTPACKLPFDSIKTTGLDIDATCSEDGDAGDNTAKRLESDAKNNFCVDEQPTPITYDDFKNLQAASDNISGLKKTLGTTRDSLAGILNSTGGARVGEGSVVRFVGHLLDAHYSNVGKGELVNCKMPGEADNDIHIELVKDEGEDDPCNGVTAEMSPHFRPEAWDGLVGLKIGRPVRVTGQLFFDSSHQPCHDGKRPSPNRISVWEIHPVYQFEVCSDKTGNACDVRNDSQWIPLDQWHGGDDENEP